MAPAIASSSSRTTLPRYTFVAELQERIRAIQVVVALHDGTAQPTLELVVSSADPRMAVLRSATTSPSSSSADQMIRIPLPAAASPITTTLSLPSPSASHYSFRLLALDTDDDDEEDDPVSSPPPLSAMELRAHRPASFACSTCSTPVVCPTEDASYQDLPSEHWEELVGSWLCHDEMKLDLGPADGSGGAGAGDDKTFWPRQKEVLVGGTYFLVEGGLVEEASFRVRRNAEVGPVFFSIYRASSSSFLRRFSSSFPGQKKAAVMTLSSMTLPFFPLSVSLSLLRSAYLERRPASARETPSWFLSTLRSHGFWMSFFRGEAGDRRTEGGLHGGRLRG